MVPGKYWLRQRQEIKMNTMVIGLMVLLSISTAAGWFFSHAKEAEKPVKVMLFVLYFWLFVFIQLVIFAVLYHFGIFNSF
jgi:hypothetical protein